MDLHWLEDAVAQHPGIENPFLRHLELVETDPQRGLQLARVWGEQEMPVSLALCTRWLPIVHSRLWSAAFFDKGTPKLIPLDFERLIEQSHGLVHNMAEEFGEHDLNRAHPVLLYRLLQELGTKAETWTSFPETDALVQAGTQICEKGTLAECIGFMWGAEKFAELEFTRILNGLTRLNVPDRLLTYWRVNVGADQEHSASLGRLVDQHVGSLRANERAPVALAAKTFFDHKASFFAAIGRSSGLS